MKMKEFGPTGRGGCGSACMGLDFYQKKMAAEVGQKYSPSLTECLDPPLARNKNNHNFFQCLYHSLFRLKASQQNKHISDTRLDPNIMIPV